MVKLQGAGISVVAAERAATASFLHEYLLDPPPALRYRFCTAFPAENSMAVADDRDSAMPDTDALAALLALSASRAAAKRF